MRRPLVKPERCGNCQPCRASAACDCRAFIREEAADKPWIDFYRCRGCLRCKPACAKGAIEELIQPCTGGRRMSW